MENKKKIAGGAALAGIVLAAGSFAIFMDSESRVLQTSVGTMDLSADTVISHTNAYAKTADDGNTGLEANNLNPGDNDHSTNDDDPDPDPKRDGTDHELTIHVQNDGNKSMITRTLIVVTGVGNTNYDKNNALGTDKHGTARSIRSKSLEQVLLYLNAAQNAKAAPAAAMSTDSRVSDPMKDGKATPNGIKKVATGLKYWESGAKFQRDTENRNKGATTSGKNTSPSLTLNPTVTATDRAKFLTPGAPEAGYTDGLNASQAHRGDTASTRPATSAVPMNNNHTELLVPLNATKADHTTNVDLPTYWTQADFDLLFKKADDANGYDIDKNYALVYEVHRNMVLGGNPQSAGVIEYENVATAKAATGTGTNRYPDDQPYIGKTAAEADIQNMVPNMKDYVIEVGLHHKVGEYLTKSGVKTGAGNRYTTTLNTYFAPELEGATLNFRVIVQAMQFRNTSDNNWKTLFTKDITTTTAANSENTKPANTTNTAGN